MHATLQNQTPAMEQNGTEWNTVAANLWPRLPGDSRPSVQTANEFVRRAACLPALAWDDGCSYAKSPQIHRRQFSCPGNVNDRRHPRGQHRASHRQRRRRRERVPSTPPTVRRSRPARSSNFPSLRSSPPVGSTSRSSASAMASPGTWAKSASGSPATTMPGSTRAGHGKYGWEEVPYWLRGYSRIAYILNDPKMLAESKVWIDGTLASQRPDGDFGPIVERDGKRDLWAQMLMLQVLQSYYEYAGRPARAAVPHRVLQMGTDHPRQELPPGLLGEQPRRRQPRERLLALQPNRRRLSARPRAEDRPQHRRLAAEQRLAQLARGEHRRVFPRAGHLLTPEQAQGGMSGPRTTSSTSPASATARCPAACSVPTRTPGPATPIRIRRPRRAASSSRSGPTFR